MTAPPLSFVAPRPSTTVAPPPAPPPCSLDESYKYVFLPVCYSLTLLFSVSLNSVVLVRACRSRRRWTTSLIYMVNLATTDLMYGLSLPFLVHSYALRDRWVFGDFTCRLVRFLFYFNLYCSIFFLTCISVHRYLGICHPMRTVSLQSKRAVRLVCALVWLLVFALTCPIFRFAQTGLVSRSKPLDQNQGQNRDPDSDLSWDQTTNSSAYVNCWDDAIDRELDHYIPYGVALHLIGFFIPFVVIAWCYSQVVRTIVHTLRSSSSSAADDVQAADAAERASRASLSVADSQYSHYARRRRKSVRTIVTITLLFALCFLPFHVTRTLFLLLRRAHSADCGLVQIVSVCYKLTRPLASCNAWLNALLYFLTGDTGGPCCVGGRSAPADGALWWPLNKLKKDAVEEENEDKMEAQVHEESKTSRVIF
ncbi:unnamed protein product [Knipowitschia caucasica]|uniref:G-protein coupled receptors family 1 profile domain-containing protein n=1 Tax=Knipowitschia caucasica TaxID=637954 RepID=A0AAV2JB52_KNICA